MKGGVETQHLLDMTLWIGHHSLCRGWHPLQNRPHPVAERVDRCLVPRIQQENPHRHNLLIGEAIAVAIFGRDHLGEEILPWGAAAGGYKLGHES